MIKVAIVEDHQKIRDGLSALIDGTQGYCCTGAFGSMEEALERLPRVDKPAEESPDIVLIDIGLPGMSGIEGVRALKERYPDLPLLILSVYGDDKRIFEGLCAGACGYLLKNTPPARLLECIREA